VRVDEEENNIVCHVRNRPCPLLMQIACICSHRYFISTYYAEFINKTQEVAIYVGSNVLLAILNIWVLVT